MPYLRLWARDAMKKGTTIYLYELAWILPSIAVPVGMLALMTSLRSPGFRVW